jgi:hypothetical protein
MSAQKAKSQPATRSRTSAAAPQPAAPVHGSTTRVWLIRAAGVLAVAIGLSMTLIGATPDIAGGWGKLVLMVPGMFLATGGFIAIIETTPLRRNKRRSRV